MRAASESDSELRVGKGGSGDRWNGTSDTELVAFLLETEADVDGLNEVGTLGRGLQLQSSIDTRDIPGRIHKQSIRIQVNLLVELEGLLEGKLANVKSSGQVSSKSQLGLGGTRFDGPLGGSIGGRTKVDGGWELCVIALEFISHEE